MRHPSVGTFHLDLLHTSLSRTARATAETRANSHVKHAPVQQLLLQMFELLLSLLQQQQQQAAQSQPQSQSQSESESESE